MTKRSTRNDAQRSGAAEGVNNGDAPTGVSHSPMSGLKPALERPADADTSLKTLAGSAPGDVKRAIAHIRAHIHRSIPIAELAAQAGVSQRTLHQHFRTFMSLAPASYGARVRLAAARTALQRPANREPITEIALRHGFPHLGRFSDQYRRAFNETPSTTRRVAAASTSHAGTEIASPAPRGDRPKMVIELFDASAGLSDLAALLAESIAGAIAGDGAVSVAMPQTARAGWRDVNARYVIRGRVVKVGERFRVVAALVDAVGGVHLWGDAWDGWAADPFGTIDRVVMGVLRAILPNIHAAEIARARRKRPDDLDAYGLCLRAYPLLAATTPATARQALDLLYRAIDREPDYALAAALAAWGHAQLVLQVGSTSPADDIGQAQLLGARAALLDPDDAVVLTARCLVHTTSEDYDVAGMLVERALARSPHSPWAWERSGWLKVYIGDVTSAIRCFGRSLRLDTAALPKATRMIGLAAGFFDDGRYGLAAQWMRRALEREPGTAWVNRCLAVAYARIGEHQAANRALEALRQYKPDITVGNVVSAMHFPPDFISRIANGLSDLGLPP
jgi:AraC-like DNA-binding protein/tetratricopeptide (TPR) repeat protein